MAATQDSARRIVVALQEHGADMEKGISDELMVLASMTANTMRKLVAPKGGIGTLLESIRQKQINPLEWEIGPNVNYAGFIEDGVKPGGKGLPPFSSGASQSVRSYLARTPPSKFVGPPPQKTKRKPRKGSPAFNAAAAALRGRYHGLALHIRNHGLKAQPFVEPTARAMEPVVLERLGLAVRRVLAARPDDFGGAAA